MKSKVEIDKLFANQTVKIDLGCGPNKKKGYIGIDILALEGVDIVANIEEGLDFIPDSCVDEIVSSHVLEHINNLEVVMNEFHRILKPTGIKKISVPHFSNPYYYSDYTHVRFFGLYSMDYFSNGVNKYKRKVPVFYKDKFKFEVLHRKLRFTSPPFYIRNKIMSMVTKLINSSVYTQELYEGWFSSIIPCSEVQFTIRPIKD